MVPISAKKGEGVDELLETIILVSEFAELKANPKAMAKGTIVEVPFYLPSNLNIYIIVMGQTATKLAF